MFNIDIRATMKGAGFFGYEVAAALGVSETYFSRLLSRGELPNDKKDTIFRTIAKMEEVRRETNEKQGH